jgi:putative ABC transport system substrate-binding protein
VSDFAHRTDSRRRQIFAALVLASFSVPVTLGAQGTSSVRRIALLSSGPPPPEGKPPVALREALRELGHVEGRNIVYEGRYADGRMEQLAALAADLVRLNVDVIVTQGWPATFAAKQATTRIPIVMAPATGDAVGTHLIQSLARPGGNVTGLSDESVELSAKRLQILKEVVPKSTHVAILWNATDQGMTLRYHEIDKAARILNVDVQALGVRESSDFPVVFETLTRVRPDALVVVSDVLTRTHRKQVIEFVAAKRIPAMYETSAYVHDGGLIAYGPNADDDFRDAARYIDRLLKGAKAADLPAQQPRRYYLSINRRTARALDLEVSESLLLRADEVVE